MFPLKDTQPSYSRPVVTITLIAVNLLVFQFEASLGPYSRNALIEYYGLVPDQVIANPYSTVPMVGASGAIAGVMGAYLVKFPRARILTLVFILFFITTIEIPAPIMLAYWFVIQLFSGLGSIARTHLSEGGTAFFAHVAGFVAGIVLVKVMGASGQYNRRRDRYWE